MEPSFSCGRFSDRCDISLANLTERSGDFSKEEIEFIKLVRDYLPTGVSLNCCLSLNVPENDPSSLELETLNVSASYSISFVDDHINQPQATSECVKLVGEIMQLVANYAGRWQRPWDNLHITSSGVYNNFEDVPENEQEQLLSIIIQDDIKLGEVQELHQESYEQYGRRETPVAKSARRFLILCGM